MPTTRTEVRLTLTGAPLMKSVLSWLAVVAIIGGAGAYGANHFHTLDREKAYKAKMFSAVLPRTLTA